MKEGQNAEAASPNVFFTDANDDHEYISNDSPELVDKKDSMSTPIKDAQSIDQLKTSLPHDDVPTHKTGTKL